ncbi:MAG: metallophosphoesterase [Deltaproteobacteria bacterium]|nr:metallophosphoesterase [Deltaproteobacteria bacterium]
MLFVFSDLHILSNKDPFYFKFLEVLKTRLSENDVVVFLGDIFDFFVGSKKIFLERYSEFFEIINFHIKRNIAFHYIEGNHDFLLSNNKMQIYPQNFSLNLENKKFYFEHGDLVDSSDWRYFLIRNALRTPFAKGLIRLSPDTWIDFIGKTCSRHSREQKIFKFEDMPKHKQEMVRKKYRNFAVDKIQKGFDFVILGHCHDLDEMVFRVGECAGQYINMGYPKVHKTYLTWSVGDLLVKRAAF